MECGRGAEVWGMVAHRLPAGEVCGREGVESVSAVIQGHQSEVTF